MGMSRFSCLGFELQVYPPFSPTTIPNCQSIHEFLMAVVGPSLDAFRESETH
jgi:hypothetical protein